MKETMLQYVSITPAERLSNGWIFPHFYTVGFPGTVVWQIRDVFLFAFIFGTIPKSQLQGLKLPIYSGWTVDPSREACWTVSPAAASLSGTPSATCPRRPWSLSLVNLCQQGQNFFCHITIGFSGFEKHMDLAMEKYILSCVYKVLLQWILDPCVFLTNVLNSDCSS